MILDITENKTVVTIIIQVMTHTLCMVELSITERTLYISNLTITYLLNEFIVLSIQDQVSIV